MMRSAKTHRITAPSRTALLRRRRSSPVPGSAVYIIDTPGARPRNRTAPEKAPKRRIPFRWTDFLVFHGRSSTSIDSTQCETPITNAAEGKITERRYSQISPSEMTLTSAKHQKYRVDRLLSTHRSRTSGPKATARAGQPQWRPLERARSTHGSQLCLNGPEPRRAFPT
jgi:hypothetical protein